MGTGTLRTGIIMSLMAITIFGCNKLDTINIGSDLIPPVDNINTFADTLDIITLQGVFDDTTRVGRIENHVLGNISDDPVAGQTTAEAYAQFKPTFYPYYYGQPRDTINPALVPGTGYDSVVLCLRYQGFWGDSTVPFNVQVYQIAGNQPSWDSVYVEKTINYAPATTTLLGSKSIDVRHLASTFFYPNRRDSVSNQIRIRLPGLEPSLFERDTLTNNSFRSDSLFKLYLNGLAIKATGGRGLIYINFADERTKLEVHYRKRNGGAIDTAYSNLRVILGSTSDTSGNVFVYPSATANHIVRTRPALPDGTRELVLQTQPGTYAELRVDSLSNYSNRIIHRASIQMEQLPDNPVTDSIFSAPPFLYIDLKDTTSMPRWKPVYVDLNPTTQYDPDYQSGLPYFPTGGVDYGYFGGYARRRTNPAGQQVVYYDFNLTKNVQRILKLGTPNYTMRLYAPFKIIYPQYFASSLPYGNRLAAGRVKLAGGAHLTRPMKMIVIYSKLP